MRKMFLLLGALLLGMASASAHEQIQSYGGHGRHQHRDWSGAYGRGHVHSVCWHWDQMEGWQWVCR